MNFVLDLASQQSKNKLHWCSPNILNFILRVILMIQIGNDIDLIENFNIIKNHVDRIQINSRLISIFIKINWYNIICHTHLLSYKLVLSGY